MFEYGLQCGATVGIRVKVHAFLVVPIRFLSQVHLRHPMLTGALNLMSTSRPSTLESP